MGSAAEGRQLSGKFLPADSVVSRGSDGNRQRMQVGAVLPERILARRIPARPPRDKGFPRDAVNARTHVLIVNDDDRARETIVRSLLQAGFPCLEAGDGERALELVEERCPGLGVLDIRLPGMSGGELAWRVRQLNLDFPLVGVLDDAAVGMWDKDDLHDLGFNALFTKPVEHKSLVEYCEGALSQPISPSADEKARLTRYRGPR